MTHLIGKLDSIPLTLADVGTRSFYLVGKDTKRMRLVQVKYIAERVIGFIDPSHKEEAKPFVIEKREVETRVRQVVIKTDDGLNHRVRITLENFSEVARGYYVNSIAEGDANKFGVISLTRIHCDEISGNTIYANHNDFSINNLADLLKISQVFFEVKDKDNVCDHLKIINFNLRKNIDLISVYDKQVYRFSASDFIDKLNRGQVALYFADPSVFTRDIKDVGVENVNSNEEVKVSA